MKIVLLIFAALQVTALEGLPMTCPERIISRFIVMMPSPNLVGKWIFFPWPIHKTVIKDGMKESDEKMIVKDEYEKEDYWSKMDGKWMEEIRDYITNKYKLSSSSIFKQYFELAGQKNSEKNENLSKKDKDWIQEIRDHFKNAYLSSSFNLINNNSTTSIIKEKKEDKKDDYWSKINGKWAQEIRDYMREKYSLEASNKFSEKNNYGKITVVKPSSEENQSGSSQLDSSEKYEKGKTGRKPNINWDFMTSEEIQVIPLKVSESEKLTSKNKGEKENSLPAEITDKLDKIGMFQIKDEIETGSSLSKETVNKTKVSFLPSSKEDGTIIFGISKIQKPKKSKTKIKEKIFVFPQQYTIKEKTSMTAPFLSGKTHSSEESYEISTDFFEKQQKGKLSLISKNKQDKDVADMFVVGCKNKPFTEDTNMPMVGCKKKNSTKSATLISTNLSFSNDADISNDKSLSEESNEIYPNFQGFGKFKGKFKKYKIPYGLAKKLQNQQDIPQSGKWSMQPKKRFTSV